MSEAHYHQVDPDTEAQLENTPHSSYDQIGDYLRSIGKISLLSAEEEVELAKEIEAGVYAEHLLGEGAYEERKDLSRAELEMIAAMGQLAIERFTNANLRLVVSRVKAINRGNRRIPLADAIQEGNTGLIRAVGEFDYKLGYKFATYAPWWIHQAVWHAQKTSRRAIRLSVNAEEKINQLLKARIDFITENNLEPGLGDLVTMTGINRRRIQELYPHIKEPLSLNQPIDEESDTELQDLLKIEQPLDRPDASVLVSELIGNLSEKEADIISERYGLRPDGEEQSAIEIAKAYQLSRPRIYQILTSALNKLRAPENVVKFKHYTGELDED